MISANEWWGLLQSYHLKIFPAQILFYLLGVTVTAVYLRKSSAAAGRLLKAYFAACFAWIGFVFFLTLGRRLPAYIAESILFFSLAALFGADLAFGTTNFSLPAGWRRTAMWIGFCLVLVGYPLAGLLHGHPASKWILPGSFPCPTAALALLFVANGSAVRFRPLHWITLGLLLLWAIPFPLLIQIPKFGAFEDGILVTAGLFAIAVRLLDARKT
jgi:hypothetical protein